MSLASEDWVDLPGGDAPAARGLATEVRIALGRFPQALVQGSDWPPAGGADEVEALFAVNPFPDEPPAVIRSQLFRYRFVTPAERRSEWRLVGLRIEGPLFTGSSLSARAQQLNAIH